MIAVILRGKTTLSEKLSLLWLYHQRTVLWGTCCLGQLQWAMRRGFADMLYWQCIGRSDQCFALWSWINQLIWANRRYHVWWELYHYLNMAMASWNLTVWFFCLFRSYIWIIWCAVVCKAVENYGWGSQHSAACYLTLTLEFTEWKVENSEWLYDFVACSLVWSHPQKDANVLTLFLAFLNTEWYTQNNCRPPSQSNYHLFQ